MRVRAIILDENNKILFGKNSFGKYSLPGGKIKENEHPVDALLREIHEEANITDYEILEYLWPLYGNHVFLITPKQEYHAMSINDPDNEFYVLEWVDLAAVSVLDLDSYSEDIIYKFLRDCVKEKEKEDEFEVEAGHIDVLVDGKKVYELDDDVIWETLPKLAQERAKGKKIEFKQVLNDGTVIDQTLNVMPKALMGGILQDAITDMVDDLLNTYIPEEKTRPLIEILDHADFLAKTTYRIENGIPITKIEVKKNISENTNVLRQVLAHEIIHHHLYQKFGKKVARHGEHFNWIAQKINEKEGADFITPFADDTEFKY